MISNYPALPKPGHPSCPSGFHATVVSASSTFLWAMVSSWVTENLHST